MFDIAELERRLANTVMVGRIADINIPKARVRVRAGDILTGWLPWLTQRAGPDRSWWALGIDEQVLVLSPSGDITQGVVLPALYQDKFPPPGTALDVHRLIYADGASLEYNRLTHNLVVNLPDGGTTRLIIPSHLTINAPGGITIAAAAGVAITGTVEVQGDVIANGISLTQHTHGGVDTGGGNTSPPQ